MLFPLNGSRQCMGAQMDQELVSRETIDPTEHVMNDCARAVDFVRSATDQRGLLQTDHMTAALNES
jgi:hypothetical protein